MTLYGPSMYHCTRYGPCMDSIQSKSHMNCQKSGLFGTSLCPNLSLAVSEPYLENECSQLWLSWLCSYPVMSNDYLDWIFTQSWLSGPCPNSDMSCPNSYMDPVRTLIWPIRHCRNSSGPCLDCLDHVRPLYDFWLNWFHPVLTVEML